MTEPLTLPRTLVVKLLSMAYAHHDVPLQGIIRKPSDKPMQFVPLTTDSTLPVNSSEIFGTYQTLPEDEQEPNLDGLPMRNGMVHVAFTLDTQGVLQLRAWRQRNDELIPEDVSVVEA